jgi:hypothetical protein
MGNDDFPSLRNETILVSRRHCPETQGIYQNHAGGCQLRVISMLEIVAAVLIAAFSALIIAAHMIEAHRAK